MQEDDKGAGSEGELEESKHAANVAGGTISQVQVYVRFFPLQANAPREKFELEKRVIRLEEAGGGRVSDFVCDGVFTESADQDEIYRCVATPLVDNLMQGVNSCCFAYGQTGSGKTYTMFGNEGKTSNVDNQRGIVSCMNSKIVLPASLS